MGLPRPNPAARLIVLVWTVAFYTLAIASYFHEPEGASALTYAYALVGTAFFGVLLFGSDNVCHSACLLFLWW